MSEPLVVVIPHRLGKDEALRRIKDGLGRAKGEFAWLLSIDQDVWTGDRLSFRASALGQTATPQLVEALRKDLGLNRPVLVRYWVLELGN